MKLLALLALIALPSLAQPYLGITIQPNDPHYNHWSPIGNSNGWYHHGGVFYRHEMRNGNWGYMGSNGVWLDQPPTGVFFGPTLVPAGGATTRVYCNC